MPKMFISNATLRELIEKATYEEKLCQKEFIV